MGGCRIIVDCDVLVVGCGPAGSGAARAAAEGGAKVIAIDKKKEIGNPVECGECVGESLLKEFNIELPKNVINSYQESVTFYLNKEIKIKNSEPYWKSYSVERRILDKHFAIEAARAGARVLADTELTDLEISGETVVLATVKSFGRTVHIKPKIVIAADGTYSTVAKEYGVNLFGSQHIGYSVEYEVVNAKIEDHTTTQIFLDEDVGFGYGWIIPKGKDRANVGLGNLGSGYRPQDSFEKFVAEHTLAAKQLSDSSIIEVKQGDTPITGILSDIVRGNTLFVGDAAGHNIAHVGEGTIPSYVCGKIAGSLAVNSIKLDQKNVLKTYHNKIMERLGDTLGVGERIKNEIVKVWGDPSVSKYNKFLVGGLLMSEAIPVDLFLDIKSLYHLEKERIIRIAKNVIEKNRLSVEISNIP